MKFWGSKITMICFLLMITGCQEAPIPADGTYGGAGAPPQLQGTGDGEDEDEGEELAAMIAADAI